MKINFNQIIMPYNIEWMKTLLFNLFQCKICMNVLNNPYDCVKCNQTFCKECITNYLNTNKKCPFCLNNKNLNSNEEKNSSSNNNDKNIENNNNINIFESIKPTSLNIVKAIKSLKLNCKFKEFGCNLELTIDEINEHEENCKYKNFQIILREKNNESPENKKIRFQDSCISFRNIDVSQIDSNNFGIQNNSNNHNFSEINNNLLNILNEKIESIYALLIYEKKEKLNSNNNENFNTSYTVKQKSKIKENKSYKKKISLDSNNLNDPGTPKLGARHLPSQSTNIIFGNKINLTELKNNNNNNNNDNKNSIKKILNELEKFNTKFTNIQKNINTIENKINNFNSNNNNNNNDNLNNNKNIINKNNLYKHISKNSNINFEDNNNILKNNIENLLDKHLENLKNYINENCINDMKKYYLDISMDNSNLFTEKIDEIQELIINTNKENCNNNNNNKNNNNNNNNKTNKNNNINFNEKKIKKNTI